MNRVNRSSINMIASLLGYAIPMIIAMVTTPMVLDGLGVSGYGLVSLINVIIGYLTVMDMGLDLPITKFLAEDKAKSDNEAANKLLNNAFQLYSIIGITGMIIIFFGAKFFAYNIFNIPDDLQSDAVIVFKLAGIGFLASVFMSWGRAVSMGVQRFEITHGVSVTTNLFGLLLGLYLIHLGYGVIGFVSMRVLFSLIAGIGYWYFVNRLLPFYKFKIGFSKKTLIRIRGYIGYGAINRIVSGMVSGLDKTLISAWVSVAAAGIYSIPFMLVSSLGYMVSYMLGFLIPISSELHSVGKLKKLRDVFTRSTKFISALTCMVFIPVLIFGDLFIKLWIDAEMSDSTKDVLWLLVISGILSTLFSSLSNNVIVGIGRIKEFTIYCTIRGAVLATGCFLLIKPLGIEGAGIALIITNIVDLCFLVIVLKNFLQISIRNLFFSAYLPPLVTGLFLAVFLFFSSTITDTWTGLIVSICIFEIVYILIGFNFGIFGETEKQIILNFFKKLHLNK